MTTYVFDLEGTLVGNPALDDPLPLLQQLYDAGHVLHLWTGRPVEDATTQLPNAYHLFTRVWNKLSLDIWDTLRRVQKLSRLLPEMPSVIYVDDDPQMLKAVVRSFNFVQPVRAEDIGTLLLNRHCFECGGACEGEGDICEACENEPLA